MLGTEADAGRGGSDGHFDFRFSASNTERASGWRGVVGGSKSLLGHLQDLFWLAGWLELEAAAAAAARAEWTAVDDRGSALDSAAQRAALDWARRGETSISTKRAAKTEKILGGESQGPAA